MKRLTSLLSLILLATWLPACGGDPEQTCDATRETRCTDGQDDDCDGQIDCADPDCSLNAACQTGAEGACNDGLDNDGDLLTDCDDPDCAEDPFCLGGPEADCDNFLDDDQDGATDCDDSDCAADPWCLPPDELDCGDGLDDDHDGLTDCADPLCFGQLECLDEAGYCDDDADNDEDGCVDGVDADCGGVESNCGDSVDNDCDGLHNCNDPDCAANPACIPATETNCANTLDDDQDGCADAVDHDCGGTETACTGGADDDCDGLTDCDDPNCVADPACAGLVEVDCADGLDGDSDGHTDCADSNCFGTADCLEETGHCADTFDNDLDSCVDGADADCGGVETNCSNASDDDCDGDTNCDDADCATDLACFDPCDPNPCTLASQVCDADQFTLHVTDLGDVCVVNGSVPEGYVCSAESSTDVDCSVSSRLCLTTRCSDEIETLRAAPDGSAYDFALDLVYVTYVGASGYYVQRYPTGPALFVWMGSTWTPDVAIGDIVILDVATLTTFNEFREIDGRSPDPLVAIDGHTDSVAFLVQDFSDGTSLGEEHESELVRIEGASLIGPYLGNADEWLFSYDGGSVGVLYFTPGFAALTPAPCHGYAFSVLAPVNQGRGGTQPIHYRLKAEHQADIYGRDDSGCDRCWFFDQAALVVDPVADGSTGETFTVTWTDLPDGQSYRVELYDGASALVETSCASVTPGVEACTSGALTAGGNYFFRVTALRGGCTAKTTRSNTFRAAQMQVLLTYSQDFDTLANTGTTNTWTDLITIPGWISNRTVYIADNGSSNTGGLHSHGTTATTERALGSVGSGFVNPVLYAVALTNSSAATISSLVVSYRGEQWRTGGVTAAHTLSFEYQIDAPAITAGTWTAATALDFVSPNTSTPAAALDGNDPANSTSRSAVLPVSIGPSQTIWLRWRDIDDSGADHGLAIDDLVVTGRGLL